MLEAVRGDAGHLFGAIQRENPFAAEAREQLLHALQRVHRQVLAGGTDEGMAIAPPSSCD
jgi:prephenate dehydrogenase